jgi:hypothetical protein
MKISNESRPISHFGEPRGVLQGPGNEEMREAVAILKLISQGEADIRDGRAQDQAGVFDELEAEFGEKEWLPPATFRKE